MSLIPSNVLESQKFQKTFEHPINLPMRDPILSSNGGTYGLGPTTMLNPTNNPPWTSNNWRDGPMYAHHFNQNPTGGGIFGDLGNVVGAATGIAGIAATATGIGAPVGLALTGVGMGTKFAGKVLDHYLDPQDLARHTIAAPGDPDKIIVEDYWRKMTAKEMEKRAEKHKMAGEQFAKEQSFKSAVNKIKRIRNTSQYEAGLQTAEQARARGIDYDKLLQNNPGLHMGFNGGSLVSSKSIFSTLSRH